MQSQAITDTIELSDGEHDTSAKHSVVSKGKMKAVEINKDDIIDLLSDHEEDRKTAQWKRSFANSKLVEEYAAKTLFWYDDTEVEEADDGNEHQEDTNREIDLWGGSEVTARIPLIDRQHKCLCSMDDDHQPITQQHKPNPTSCAQSSFYPSPFNGCLIFIK